MADEQERDKGSQNDGEVMVDGEIIEERRFTRLSGNESDFVEDKEETP